MSNFTRILEAMDPYKVGYTVGYNGAKRDCPFEAGSMAASKYAMGLKDGKKAKKNLAVKEEIE
jgi:hypothetical protein